MQLRLDALQPESAGELLRSLLGVDAELKRLARVLMDRTGGNPLFLEESVRTLVETGALVGERGAYRLARPVDTIQVPATVQAILAARIDRLPAPEKQLLQTAAVVGHDVPLPLLQVVADANESDLRSGLAHLQAAEFLYETSLFPESVYAFKHALTHEVAYGSLLQARRTALHARIVEAIETLPGERSSEQVERLAHHAFRGELWRPAVSYLRQAGTRAVARSAYREAVARFEEALSALANLPEDQQALELAVDLRLDFRGALWALGERTRLSRCLGEAEALAKRLTDQRRLGWVSAYASVESLGQGDLRRGVQLARRALAIAERAGDFELRVASNYYLGLSHNFLGDYAEALKYLDWNVASISGDRLRERMRLPGMAAVISRSIQAQVLGALGAFADATLRIGEALKLAADENHPLSLSIAYVSLGWMLAQRGNFAEALPVLERAVELCRDVNAVWLPRALLELGRVYAFDGRFTDALRLLDAAETPSRGEQLRTVQRFTALGETLLLAGRSGDAHEPATRALERASKLGARGNEAWALRLLGEIAAHQDPPEREKADDHYRHALALAEELGMRPLVAHCHLGLGRLYRRTGKREQAQEHLATATTMYRDMGMTYWLAEAEGEVSRVE